MRTTTSTSEVKVDSPGDRESIQTSYLLLLENVRTIPALFNKFIKRKIFKYKFKILIFFKC